MFRPRGILRFEQKSQKIIKIKRKIKKYWKQITLLFETIISLFVKRKR